MSKLMEWLLCLGVYLALWMSLLNSQVLQDWRNIILLLPVVSLTLFAIYSVSVVVWRVYCFNDCPEAAKELQEQIVQAKEDLAKKGLKI